MWGEKRSELISLTAFGEVFASSRERVQVKGSLHLPRDVLSSSLFFVFSFIRSMNSFPLFFAIDTFYMYHLSYMYPGDDKRWFLHGDLRCINKLDKMRTGAVNNQFLLHTSPLGDCFVLLWQCACWRTQLSVRLTRWRVNSDHGVCGAVWCSVSELE